MICTRSPRLRNDFHATSSVRSSTSSTRGGRSPAVRSPSAPSSVDARPWCAGRRTPSGRRRRPSARRRGPRARSTQGEAHHLLGGALAVRAGLRAVGHAAAAPLRRRGSSPAGRGRCPSGATASRHHRRTSARVLVLCVPARAAASWAVTTWCITATFGSMPNTASGRSTEPPSAPVWVFIVSELTSPPPSRRRGRTRDRRRDRAPSRVTRSRLRSGSLSMTSRFSVVVRTLPCWPAIFMPLNTRAGVAQAPIEPGARCFLWLPCDAPWPLKLCRCIAPVKPLPFETPVTSTRSPLANTSTTIVWPTAKSARSSTRSSTRCFDGADAAPWRGGRARAC